MISLLLDHLWQSSICAGAAALIVLALRRNGAAVRFWVWFAASLKFLVPFAALTALGGYALAPMVPPVAVPAMGLAEPFAKPFSGPVIVQFTANLAERSMPPLPPPPARSPAETGAAIRASSAEHALPARSVPMLPSFRLDPESVLLAVWAAGALTLALRWLARWLRVRALLRDAAQADIDAPVAVKFTASRLEPGLVGIFAPVILLPLGIAQQLSPAELKAVLAHELCHWRRRDNLLAAIHMLVEMLFWFVPFVWWIGARLNAERERACDESVLADGTEPRIYADGILKVCRACLQSPLACVSGISGAGLKTRIAAIMENRLVPRLNAARKFVLGVSAAGALCLPVAMGLLAAPAAQIQAKAAPVPSAGQTRQRAEQAPPLWPRTAAATPAPNRAAENPAEGRALPSDETAAEAGEAQPSPRLPRLLPMGSLAVPLPDLPQLSRTMPGPLVPRDRPTAPAQPAPSGPVTAAAHKARPGAPIAPRRSRRSRIAPRPNS